MYPGPRRPGSVRNGGYPHAARRDVQAHQPVRGGAPRRRPVRGRQGGEPRRDDVRRTADPARVRGHRPGLPRAIDAAGCVGACSTVPCSGREWTTRRRSRARPQLLRDAVGAIPVPDDVRRRSSASTDGSATASRSRCARRRRPRTPRDVVRGMNETYNNVVGDDAVIARVRDCWTSLSGDGSSRIARARHGRGARARRRRAAHGRLRPVGRDVHGRPLDRCARPARDRGRAWGWARSSCRARSSPTPTSPRTAPLLSVRVGRQSHRLVPAGDGR